VSTILKELELVQRHSECLLDAAGVEQMLDRLAEKITLACKDENPLILCVMTGAVVAVGLLVPRLAFPLEIDYIHATRYRGNTSGGNIVWEKFPNTPLKGRTVVIIDDVLDEGETMQQLMDYCQSEGARRCLSAVLVDKNLAKEKPIQADFVGMQTDDRYLYGLGMDYKGYLRNANGVYACPTNLQALICQL
jgi:hypoxanthine phosphoribosyltransferase